MNNKPDDHRLAKQTYIAGILAIIITGTMTFPDAFFGYKKLFGIDNVNTHPDSIKVQPPLNNSHTEKDTARRPNSPLSLAPVNYGYIVELTCEPVSYFEYVSNFIRTQIPRASGVQSAKGFINISLTFTSHVPETASNVVTTNCTYNITVTKKGSSMPRYLGESIGIPGSSERENITLLLQTILHHIRTFL